MTTRFLKPDHTAEPVGGAAVKISGGYMRLDSFGIPYGDASVELPYPGSGFDDIDPRDPVRVVVRGRADPSGAPVRAFNMGLRSRRIDHRAKTVTIELATDEALLIDYATLTTDAGARAYEASLRGIVNYVLGKVLPGTTLAAGTTDAVMTAAYQATNLITNPSMETGTTGWTQGGNGTGMATSNARGGVSGSSYALHWAVPAAGYSYVECQNMRVTAGETYGLSAYFIGSSARSCRVLIRFMAENGAILRDAWSSPVTCTTSGWTARPEVIAQAPIGTTKATLYFEYLCSSPTEYVWLDGAMFYESWHGEGLSYFDGARADDALYTYDWSGTAHGSPSVRTPIVDRSPELFVWDAGVTAWDFLQPLLTAAGLRLFCDEARVWRLIAPDGYYIAGLKPLTPDLLSEGADIISRSDSAVFATGVVVRYTWTVDGRELIQTDAAGTPDRVAVIDYERPYPGPGAAAAILARRDGTGRVQEVTALADWALTPAMNAAIYLPGAPEQQGKVVSVEWDLGDIATMNVGTSGLIDVYPGTIDALDGTIDGLTGTIDSLN